MNTIRVVSSRQVRCPPGGQACRRPAAVAASLIILCLGFSSLAAQTASDSTRRIATRDPNTIVVQDPNAVSDSRTATDPNQAPASDPNQVSIRDPDQVHLGDPNQVSVSDANRVSISDPNQVSIRDPNQVLARDPNQVPISEPNAGLFNQPGNILIADQLNHRVIEVDGTTHEVVWQFGDGNGVAGPKSVVAPHDAQRVGEWTLICGTGTAAGAEPNSTAGSPDNRVLLVDRSGRIIWQYGRAGVAGGDVNELNAPTCAVFLPYSHVLITDQGNHRVIEVSLVTKQIVWQHGTTGVAGATPNCLDSPSSAQWLDNGHILIADQGNNRVIEVNRRHWIVWRYGGFQDANALRAPAYACRLPNHHTLITDTGNNRILEVDRRGQTLMEFATNQRAGSVADPLVWRAVRLENGATLISDQFNHEVLEIDSQSNVIFTQGALGTPGSGPNQLNCPCDAKVIGDYTGLTLPSLDSYGEWAEDPQPQDGDWDHDLRPSHRGGPRGR